jgi:hypothetical protein
VAPRGGGDKLCAGTKRKQLDIAAVIAGEASGLIRDIIAAQEVVDRIIDQATALLPEKLR